MLRPVLREAIQELQVLLFVPVLVYLSTLAWPVLDSPLRPFSCLNTTRVFLLVISRQFTVKIAV